jgi:hypothetical protein
MSLSAMLTRECHHTLRACRTELDIAADRLHFVAPQLEVVR